MGQTQKTNNTDTGEASGAFMYWNGYKHIFTLEKVLAAFMKLNMYLPYVPTVSFLGIYAREMKTHVQKKDST